MNLYDFVGAEIIDVKLEVENLGILSHLRHAFDIGSSFSDGYNKVKDKFSKKEGTAVIESASKANIQTQTAS